MSKLTDKQESQRVEIENKMPIVDCLSGRYKGKLQRDMDIFNDALRDMIYHMFKMTDPITIPVIKGLTRIVLFIESKLNG